MGAQSQMNKKLLIAVTGLVAVAFGAYLIAANIGNGKSEPKMEETQDIKALVAGYSTDKLQAESASIMSDRLTVTASDGKKLAYELPSDEFFVSFAPYLNKTHPCSMHNLVTCRGELANTAFDVLIQDAQGNAVIDQTLQSNTHGFVDLWLPRGQTYTIAVTYDGRSASSTLSTNDGDNTCITTLQLK